MYTFQCDIHKKKILIDCTLNPTEVLQTKAHWLYAKNNKYDPDMLKLGHIGKWMIFTSQADVDELWRKVKLAIKEGHLWDAKVSTVKPCDRSHVVIIYTKDYTDLKDVISVLDYLETSGIKPADKIIRYKTDQQTYAGIYSGGSQKASIYDSGTIRTQTFN